MYNVRFHILNEYSRMHTKLIKRHNKEAIKTFNFLINGSLTEYIISCTTLSSIPFNLHLFLKKIKKVHILNPSNIN